MGLVTDGQIAEVFSKMFGMEVSRIKVVEIQPEAVKLLKTDQLRRYCVYPVKIDNGKLICR